MNEIKLQIADKYIQLAITYLDQINQAQWALGDLLFALVNVHDGRRYEVLSYMTSQLNCPYHILDKYERTARRWHDKDRPDNLPWTIFSIANPDKHQALVNKAADENWNTTTFKEHINPINPLRVIKQVRAIVCRLINTGKLNSATLELVEVLNDMLDDMIEEMG